MEVNVKIKKLDERAKIPTKGSKSAAGYDLYALETTAIKGSENTLVRTGLAMEIPEGYYAAIYARSGLASKHSLRPANCVGIIDSDYRGEVKVILHNDKCPVKTVYRDIPGLGLKAQQEIVIPNHDASYTVEAGDRIAQLIICKEEDVLFEEVTELSDSDRGEGGFGSTGSN